MKALPVCIMLVLALPACDKLPAIGGKESTSPALTAPQRIERGNTLLKDGKQEAALAEFDAAIAQDAKEYRAYQGKGIALAELGKFDAAEEAYNKALSLKPQSPSVRNNLAMSLIMRGEYAKAETILVQLSKESPQNQTVQENLALSKCLQGKEQEARQLYAKNLKPAQVQENLRFCRKFEHLRKQK